MGAPLLLQRPLAARRLRPIMDPEGREAVVVRVTVTRKSRRPLAKGARIQQGRTRCDCVSLLLHVDLYLI